MNELTTETRNWAMVSHLSPVLVQLMLPSLGFLGPLLVMFFKQDDTAVTRHAQAALKFQLTMMVMAWVIGALGAATSCFLIGWFIAPFALIPLVAGYLVPIYAAIKVNNGERFRYPLTGGPG